jgi:MHS family proline/betaine transporter-like MFS transporter
VLSVQSSVATGVYRTKKYMRLEEKKQETFASLKREQKEALGLLSAGTFLEYFDLMLYVHMAVLLNELFFPKTIDPHIASLRSAFAFCSTYLLRPFGALIFGYLGDTVGRKTTVVLTTFIMAISCLVMANLPTYAQIGVTASWIVTLCRVAQGMSSMGEIVGSEIYLTEITRPPIQYPIVTLVSIFSVLGGNLALAVAYLTTSTGLNWRVAFWIGTLVAVVGSVARTRLRETPEFVDARLKIKRAVAEGRRFVEELDYIPAYHERASIRTLVAYFFMECGWPACFYFTYMHCGNILKHTFGFTPEQVISQNFGVSIVNLVGYIIIAYLSYRVYPLKILKVKAIVFLAFILIAPYLLMSLQTPFELFLVQAFVMLFVLGGTSAKPIFLKHLPIFRRFTYAGLMYALSRTSMSIIISLGLVYLGRYFGHWGVFMMMLPVALGYTFSVFHFEQLEKKVGNYPQKIPVSTR